MVDSVEWLGRTYQDIIAGGDLGLRQLLACVVGIAHVDIQIHPGSGDGSCTETGRMANNLVARRLKMAIDTCAVDRG